MLTNISWTVYIGFIIFLLVVWYIIIGLRFYLSDLQALLSGKRKLAFRISDRGTGSAQSDKYSEPSDAAPTSAGEEESDTLSHQAEVLTEKIKDAISGAASKNYPKEEFIFLLQLTLKEYPALKGTSYQAPVNHLIAFECDKHGFIRLSAEELMMLWIEV